MRLQIRFLPSNVLKALRKGEGFLIKASFTLFKDYDIIFSLILHLNKEPYWITCFSFILRQMSYLCDRSEISCSLNRTVLMCLCYKNTNPLTHLWVTSFVNDPLATYQGAASLTVTANTKLWFRCQTLQQQLLLYRGMTKKRNNFWWKSTKPWLLTKFEELIFTCQALTGLWWTFTVSQKTKHYFLTKIKKWRVN